MGLFTWREPGGGEGNPLYKLYRQVCVAPSGRVFAPLCSENGYYHSKQIKLKIKTVQQIKSRIWEMKGSKYTKPLAKNQVRRIFRIRDIRRNVLSKFIEICMETPCWCPPGWAPAWRTETNKNICLIPSFGTKA